MNVINFEGSNVKQLENATMSWIKIVKSAMDAAIPKSTHQYIYQLKTTPEIRDLETQFKNLKRYSTLYGWTQQTYREYLRIKVELRERCKAAYNKNWEDKINHISENSKNSKQFWNKINVLKGKMTVHTNYMKDVEGNKYFSDIEKYNVMEKTWKDVFKVTEEEENNFDKNHSDYIDGFINVNSHRVKTFPTVMTSRLNTESYHTEKLHLRK